MEVDSTFKVLENENKNAPMFKFQSVVQIGKSVQEIITLSKELPSHADQVIKIVEPLLLSCMEARTNEYTSLVVTESSSDDSNNKGVISATWIRDEDFHRLLKSLS